MSVHRASSVVLLVMLGVLTGCSCNSSFWDRSPCVGGAQAPRSCAPPPCAPRQASRPAPEADPLAPPQAQQPVAQQPATAFAARPPAVARMGVGASTADDHEVLRQVNAIRHARGIRPLTFNDQLWVAARDHSAEQMRHGYMGHGSPDPKRDDLVERMHLANYAGRTYGEVVAWGYRDTRSAVEGWMNSPPHRAVLLDPDYTEAAFSRSGLYWTGNFGAPDFRRRTPGALTTSPAPRASSKKVSMKPIPTPAPTTPPPRQMRSTPPPSSPQARPAPEPRATRAPTPAPAPKQKERVFFEIPNTGFG